MDTKQAAAAESAAATAKKSQSITKRKISPQEQQYLKAIAMSSAELGAVIRALTERIAQHLGNALAHDVHPWCGRSRGQDRKSSGSSASHSPSSREHSENSRSRSSHWGGPMHLHLAIITEFHIHSATFLSKSSAISAMLQTCSEIPASTAGGTEMGWMPPYHDCMSQLLTKSSAAMIFRRSAMAGLKSMLARTSPSKSIPGAISISSNPESIRRNTARSVT